MNLLLLLACGAVEPLVAPLPPARVEATEVAPCPSDGRSCFELGMQARSERAGEAAFTLFEHGCAAGEPFACQAAGDALRRGDGAERSLAAAQERYEAACRHMAVGCELASFTAELAADLERCGSGDPASCRRGCAEGDAGACGRIEEVLRQTCTTGEAQACTLVGTAVGRGWLAGTPDEANALLWRGCDLDDPWGCLRLADRLRRGEGTNPSPKNLAWLENQVCDLQLWYGCASHR